MLDKTIIQSVQDLVGKDNVLTHKEDLCTYSYDATTELSHMPDIVVFPQTNEQISKIVKLSNHHKIPVTARGAGTNLSGGSIPVKGGIVLCLTKMNKIIDINKYNLTAIVEPGVILHDFNLEIAKQNLFYPPDPQSFLACTIGGTIAENAGGPNAVKYGVTKQYVIGMEVVTGTGDIIKLGGVTVKNRTGYELMMLFTGSEGTLGIITKIVIRLLPMPSHKKTILAVFDSIINAGESVSKMFEKGIIPAKIEFLDNWFLQRIEQLTPMGLPIKANAIVLFETDGNSEAAIMEEAMNIIKICKNTNCLDSRIAKDDQEALNLWKARKAGFAAIFSSSPTIVGEDVTVPRDKLAPFLQKVDSISQQYGIPIHVLGHAGDGNIHPAIPTDSGNIEHYKKANKMMDEMFDAALSFGGVLSGEHGIGLEKQRYLKKAMDPLAIEIMKKIKNIMDPNNILNPGKIWES